MRGYVNLKAHLTPYIYQMPRSIASCGLNIRYPTLWRSQSTACPENATERTVIFLRQMRQDVLVFSLLYCIFCGTCMTVSWPSLRVLLNLVGLQLQLWWAQCPGTGQAGSYIAPQLHLLGRQVAAVIISKKGYQTKEIGDHSLCMWGNRIAMVSS